MDITGATAATSSAAEASGSKLGETFDTFLTLLTTQLQNQDPLEPLDSSEFTQQLVMYTSAEQQIAANKNLETLIGLFQGGQAASAVGYLGTTVQAPGDAALLSDGIATWQYDVSGAATQATVTITDDTGQVVFSGNAEAGAGAHSFVWNGTDQQGLPVPDGIYTIDVIAKDLNGQEVPVTTAIEGKVDGVESAEDGSIVLSVGGIKIPLSEVLHVKQTVPPDASGEGDGTA